MLNCKDATHRMSEAEDRSLGLGERLELTLHLAICQGCRNYQQHLHVLRDACRGYREHLLDANNDLLRPEQKGES